MPSSFSASLSADVLVLHVQGCAQEGRILFAVRARLVLVFVLGLKESQSIPLTRFVGKSGVGQCTGGFSRMQEPD